MGAVMFGNGVSGVATNGLGMLFLAIFPAPAATADKKQD